MLFSQNCRCACWANLYIALVSRTAYIVFAVLSNIFRKIRAVQQERRHALSIKRPIQPSVLQGGLPSKIAGISLIARGLSFYKKQKRHIIRDGILKKETRFPEWSPAHHKPFAAPASAPALRCGAPLAEGAARPFTRAWYAPSRGRGASFPYY
jgi:hypothetical protein